MQVVSTAWKNAQQNTVTPKTKAVISLSSTPNTDVPTPTATNVENTLSDLSMVTDLSTSLAKYAVLELNQIELSMDNHILPSDMFPKINQCYTSTLSAYNPIITLTFPNVQTETLKEFTIIWGVPYEDNFAYKYDVAFYNGGTLIDTINVDGNTEMINHLTCSVSGYNVVKITIYTYSLSNVRKRLQMAFAGTILQFEDNDIISFSHKESFDPLSFALPVSRIDFELDNLNQQWNPDVSTGLYKYLASRQKLIAEYGFVLQGGAELISGGEFYMSDWDTPQNGITAKFTAKGLIDFMDVDFDVNALMTDLGVVTPIEDGFNCYLTDIAKSAFKQCGITDYVLLNLAGNDEEITINTELGYKCSQVLQYAANALKAIIYSDRSGIVNVAAWNKNTPVLDSTYTISQFVSYKNAEYEQTKDIKAVDVNNGLGGYIAVGKTTGEIQTIQNPFIQSKAHADSVGAWIYLWLSSVKLVSGEYRADPRLDLGDKVSLETRYATNDMIVTEYEYKFGGMVNGTYRGRIV